MAPEVAAPASGDVLAEGTLADGAVGAALAAAAWNSESLRGETEDGAGRTLVGLCGVGVAIGAGVGVAMAFEDVRLVATGGVGLFDDRAVGAAGADPAGAPPEAYAGLGSAAGLLIDAALTLEEYPAAAVLIGSCC